MDRTINIKKAHVRNLFLSFLIGFVILYGVEHSGQFKYIADYIPNTNNGKVSFTTSVKGDTPVATIVYKSFFNSEIRTGGNGFDVSDLNYAGTSFDKYSNKSYYYTQATIKDYKYGVFLSIGIFILTIFFTEFKIRLS
jgi:hypothetical protein